MIIKEVNLKDIDEKDIIVNEVNSDIILELSYDDPDRIILEKKLLSKRDILNLQDLMWFFIYEIIGDVNPYYYIDLDENKQYYEFLEEEE